MNVVRHARAKKAKVSVWLKNESINIEVEDDGIGFSRSALNNKQAQGGFGLFSIRERLNNFDGSLEINSRRGQGARIKISVPVQ
jgi:signal transduction histidine kinase